MRWITGVGLIVLVWIPFAFLKSGDRSVRPAVDLRRLILPETGATVTERGPERTRYRSTKSSG
jgi:hypothetical protein